MKSNLILVFHSVSVEVMHHASEGNEFVKHLTHFLNFSKNKKNNNKKIVLYANAYAEVKIKKKSKDPFQDAKRKRFIGVSHIMPFCINSTLQSFKSK